MSYPQGSAHIKDGPLSPGVTFADARAAGARELVAAATMLMGTTLALLWLSDGFLLVTRPLWLDEIHTVLVAGAESPWGVIGHLANGADHGPPLYFLLMWTLRAVSGALAPELLRLCALVSVWGATVLAYAVLRRGFGLGASGLGAAALWTNALVVTHAFEGRFYGLWLLCAAYLAWSLPPAAGHRARRTTLAIAAVLLCTVHWYGVIALTMMAAGATMAAWRGWRAYLPRLTPALAGIAATALCVPLALGQRRAITLSTWVPEFTWGQLGAFVRAFWFGPLPRIALAIIALALIVAMIRRRGGRAGADLSRLCDPSIAALMILALFPVALALLSLVGQPSMLGRYSIPAVLAWAPLVALAAQLAGRWVTAGVALAIAWQAFAGITRETAAKERFVSHTVATAQALRAARALGVPVAFQSMHDLYAVAWADAPAARGVPFLALPDEALARVMPTTGRFYQLNKGLQVQRDLVRVHSARFGFPATITPDSLATFARFALVVNDETLPRATTIQAVGALLFPGHSVRRESPELAVFERRP